MLVEFLEDYLSIVIFLFLSLGLSVGFIILNYLFSPKNPDPEKLSAYECGFEAFSDSRMKFDVRFYLVAILFIIFDLEIAFLFPWAISLGNIGSLGFWSMIIFLAIMKSSKLSEIGICRDNILIERNQEGSSSNFCQKELEVNIGQRNPELYKPVLGGGLGFGHMDFWHATLLNYDKSVLFSAMNLFMSQCGSVDDSLGKDPGSKRMTFDDFFKHSWARSSQQYNPLLLSSKRLNHFMECLNSKGGEEIFKKSVIGNLSIND